MKVIHLISGGDSGGAKTHVLSLLQNLNKTITAQLVCFRDGPFAEEARAMGIPTMICGGNNIPHLRRELADYIRQGGLSADPLPRQPGQHDRGPAAKAHGPAGGVHRPQRLQAGLHGPPLRPSHLRGHQRLGPAASGLPHRRVRRHGGPAHRPGLPPRPVLRHLQRHRLHPRAASGRPAGLSRGVWGPTWTRTAWWWASPPG